MRQLCFSVNKPKTSQTGGITWKFVSMYLYISYKNNPLVKDIYPMKINPSVDAELLL